LETLPAFGVFWKKSRKIVFCDIAHIGLSDIMSGVLRDKRNANRRKRTMELATIIFDTMLFVVTGISCYLFGYQCGRRDANLDAREARVDALISRSKAEVGR